MKHKKTVKSFYFTSKIEKILEELGEITLPKQVDLINRVHNRYPLISQIETVIIIKTIFEVIRELLVRGCIININRFFFDFKLHFFQHNRNTDKINKAVKVKIKTPPSWKERPSWKRYKTTIKM